MKRRSLVRVFCFAAAFLMILAASGCASGGRPAPTAVQNGGPVTGVEGRYDPPIEITSAITLNPDTKFENGDDIHNNVWTRAYLEELGISVKYLWTVDGSQYGQKLNMVIASNSLPDFFVCNAEQLSMLNDSGMLTDMTDVYNQYASPDTRAMLERDPIGFKAAQINGRLMGLPSTDSSHGGAAVLWIRNDWLNKLGLQIPQTFGELMDAAQAFADRDPDGNGQKDTFGMAFCKSLWSSFADMTGVFNAYHAYPNMWIKDDSGKAVFGSVQPEMKEALRALQGMYRNGLIDPEFGTKDSVKVSEDALAGRVGIQYGAWWNPSWPLQTSKIKDPNSDWVPLSILSADGKPALAQYGCAVGSFIVANRDFQHPEALVKMMNMWTGIVLHPSVDMALKYVANFNNPGVVYYKYITVMAWDPDGNINKWEHIRDAIQTGKLEGLTLEEQLTLEVIDKYTKGDTTKWEGYIEHGPTGSMGVIAKVRDGLGIANLFYGAATPVMTEKMPALIKMQDETVTNIILGADVDETFDKFVSDFNKLGGEAITDEVNEWYKKNYN